MALNKNVEGNTKPASASNNQPANLESAIAKLAVFISKDDGDLDKGDGKQVAELLERLGEADDVAQGVEERLDGIIGNLDALLAELEKESALEKSADVSVPKKIDEAKST